jgi:uncharacterized membrane protein YoaK (UPF0700 family)
MSSRQEDVPLLTEPPPDIEISLKNPISSRTELGDPFANPEAESSAPLILAPTPVHNPPPPTALPPHMRPELNAVVIGGLVMAFQAGFINVVALLATTWTVSHNTGTVTRAGIWAANGSWRDFLLALGVLGAFLSGSGTVGFFIRTERFHPNRKYGFLLIFESLVLFLMEGLLHSDDYYNSLAVVVGSYACGLQNALVSNLSGYVVRNTHVTGLLTDLGLVLGHFLRGREKTELWRLKVLVPILAGFLSGAIAGATAYERLGGTDALIFPAFFILLLGIIWTGVRLRYRQRAMSV